MIILLVNLIINLFCVTDTFKLDKFIYVENSCFNNFLKQEVPDSVFCFSFSLGVKHIDDSTYIMQRLECDSNEFITYKKSGDMLLYKLNGQFKLFFDFKTRKGGNIKKFMQGTPVSMEQYKIECVKKIKIRGENLYQLRYKPIGFSSSETWEYYYNEEGECVIIAGGFLYKYYIRTDHFYKELTDEELNSLE